MFFFLIQTEQGDIFKITLSTEEDIVRLFCLFILFLNENPIFFKFVYS